MLQVFVVANCISLNNSSYLFSCRKFVSKIYLGKNVLNISIQTLMAMKHTYRYTDRSFFLLYFYCLFISKSQNKDTTTKIRSPSI